MLLSSQVRCVGHARKKGLSPSGASWNPPRKLKREREKLWSKGYVGPHQTLHARPTSLPVPAIFPACSRRSYRRRLDTAAPAGLWVCLRIHQKRCTRSRLQYETDVCPSLFRLQRRGATRPPIGCMPRKWRLNSTAGCTGSATFGPASKQKGVSSSWSLRSSSATALSIARSSANK